MTPRSLLGARNAADTLVSTDSRTDTTLTSTGDRPRMTDTAATADTPFPRLERGRLTIASEVADVIRWRIIDGSMPAGSRLREERISTEMGISRGPVREALRLLEQDGLAASEAYRGSVVVGVSTRELRDVLIPVRWALEKAAVEAALPRLTDEDLEQLAQLTCEMREAEAGSTASLRRLVDLDVAFHAAIVERSGLYHCQQLWLTTQPRIRLGFYRLGTMQERTSRIAEEHEELLAALRTRDLDQALAALDEHTRSAPLQLLAKLDAHEAGATVPPIARDE